MCDATAINSVGLFYAMKETDELGMFVLFPTKLLEILTPRQAVIMGMIIGWQKRAVTLTQLIKQ